MPQFKFPIFCKFCWNIKYSFYHEVLKKQGVVGVVAHERLTKPRIAIEWLLAKPSSLSDFPAFLGPNRRNLNNQYNSYIIFIYSSKDSKSENSNDQKSFLSEFSRESRCRDLQREQVKIIKRIFFTMFCLLWNIVCKFLKPLKKFRNWLIN